MLFSSLATTGLGPLFDGENSTQEEGTEVTSHPAVELPFGIQALAPALLLELATVVACNLILMALVIKARKVNNNTNIYLFSLSVCGLLRSLNLFTLMVAVFARKWVFGRELCYLNDFLLRLSFFPILPTHALVSRDRYKAIRDPLNYWKVSTRKTYVLNFIVWIVSAVLSLSSVVWYVVRTPLSNGPLNGLECFFGLDLIQGGFSDSLVELVSISVFNILWTFSLSVFTLWHYFLVLRELHMLTKLRSQFRVLSNSSRILKVNGRDKPLHCTAEERAAKSLALMFLFEFICSLLSLGIISIVIVLMLSSQYQMMAGKISAIIVVSLAIYILPGINPMVLALTNKRFRKRVKGLIRCELKPELEESNDNGHLNEADEIQLPSVGTMSFTKRQSVIFINKTNMVQTPSNTQESSVCHDEEREKNEEMRGSNLVRRNTSIANIDAIRVEMNCEKTSSPHDITPSTDAINS